MRLEKATVNVDLWEQQGSKHCHRGLWHQSCSLTMSEVNTDPVLNISTHTVLGYLQRVQHTGSASSPHVLMPAHGQGRRNLYCPSHTLTYNPSPRSAKVKWVRYHTRPEPAELLDLCRTSCTLSWAHAKMGLHLV
jgi:hypothetical protein